jgi:nicotinamidase-related amidase
VSGAGPIDGALLLCLDMQPAFIRAVPGGDRVLARCRFAVAAAAGLGIPVAFTEQVPAKLGGTEPTLLVLVPQPEVHPKDAFSALAAGTEARQALTARRRVEHVLLAGVETPICVFQTAVDALQSAIAVTVLSDCVGARRPDDAAACLASLARAGAHVLPSETVFYSVLGGAAHPFFRAFTDLVKSHA